MSRRKPILILVLLGLCLTLAGETAFAWNPFECASDAWYSVCRDWKRNNCWPEPFVCPDRMAVRMPFAIQVANGWRSRNTLDDLYFKENGSELSNLGRDRIRYLLMNTPCAYRAIYVLRVCDPEMTSARLVSVQNAVNEACGGQMPVPVMLTSSRPAEYSGEETNLIRRKHLEWLANPNPGTYPKVMGNLDKDTAGVIGD